MKKEEVRMKKQMGKQKTSASDAFVLILPSALNL